MQELHAIVHGKVQGVWYRAWTRDTAREMGVTGWVRNLPGGEVETVCQGDSALVDRFLEKLHDGPPLARVTQIKVTRRAAEAHYEHFEVRV